MLRKEEKGPTRGHGVCGCRGREWRGFPRKSRERGSGGRNELASEEKMLGEKKGIMVREDVTR